MSKEASRIRRVISRITSREDLVELLKLAQREVVHGLTFRDLARYDRGVAVYEATRERLGDASSFGQLPRYAQVV